MKPFQEIPECAILKEDSTHKGTITESQFKVLFECLTEAKSSIGGMRNNSANKLLPIAKERSIISEGIDWDVPNDIRRGTIVFSTDISAEELLNNRFVDFLRQKLATFMNRVNATPKNDAMANAHNLIGWTIGHNYDGRYRAKNGMDFAENSLSLDIVGISDDDLISIATEICRSLVQECVLILSRRPK